MSAQAAILIQEHPADTGDWRKFVAILCFIEFYTRFVSNGYQIRYVLEHHRSNHPFVADEIYPLAACSAAMLRAVIFYGLGRSLWYSSRRSAYWLWAAITSSLVDIALLILGAFAASSGWYAALWQTDGQMSNQITWPPLLALILASKHLPWAGLLLVYLWHTAREPLKTVRYRQWVLFAAAWSLTSAPLLWIVEGENWCCPGMCLHDVRQVGLAYCMLPPLICVLLLLRWRLARTAALVLAIFETISVAIWMLYPFLVYCAIRVLRIAHRLSPDIGFWKFHLGHAESFQFLFVYLVAYAGPWLLIALYAWRVPMRPLPDDGSPFPRHYCDRCGYNLHGLASTQCPECGSRLKPIPPAVARSD